MVNFNLYEYYNNIKANDIILSFKGALSQEILVEIGSIIRNKFAVERSLKKIFAVFVELAQNIMHYSAETEFSPRDNKEVGVGIIVFSESETNYFIGSGNMIKNSKVDKIKGKIDNINNMSHDELKDFYQDQRRKPSDEDSKGAGLGFIDIARKSGNKVIYDINKIDDENSFLVLTVKFNKDNA